VAKLFLRSLAITLGLGAGLIAGADREAAAGCLFDAFGEGAVADVVDGRSFRLDDGREIRLLGIEAEDGGKAALAAIVTGQDVTLRGTDETPDRYGRQSAFAFLGASEIPVQSLLLAQGQALVSTEQIGRAHV